MKARQIFDKRIGTVVELYDRVAVDPTYTHTHTHTHTYKHTQPSTLSPTVYLFSTVLMVADVSFTACGVCNQSTNNSLNLKKVAALATHSLQ